MASRCVADDAANLGRAAFTCCLCNCEPLTATGCQQHAVSLVGLLELRSGRPLRSGQVFHRVGSLACIVRRSLAHHCN
jgi:hypothetical protein